ncbi:MAG: MarR family transcriptional regulator [bacterium]|nr:MarR family transcriptional regulator [bacterium]
MAKPDAIIGLVSIIREKANKRITEELESNGVAGLVPSHGAILGMLYTHGIVPMTEMAALIHRDNSTVTTLTEKLAALQYVSKTKDPHDKRITNISLTEKGRDLQPVFEEISQKILERLYEGFSDLEKDMLIRLLERMLGNC